MSGVWFYRALGQQYGPLGAEELRTLARSGLLRPDTPVKQGRDGPWSVAEEVQGLFSDDRPSPALSAPPVAEAAPRLAAATTSPPPAVEPGALGSIILDGQSRVAAGAAGDRWVLARNVLLGTTFGLVILILLVWIRPSHRASQRPSKPVGGAASPAAVAASAVPGAARSGDRATTPGDRATTPAAAAAAPAAAGHAPQQRFEQFAQAVDARLAEVLKQTIQDDEESDAHAARSSAAEWQSLAANQQSHNGEIWESVAADVEKADSPAAAERGTLSFAWTCRVGDYLPILTVVRWKCSYGLEGGRWTFKSARATVVKAAPYGMDAPEKELLSGDEEALRIAAKTQCLQWLNPALNRPILQLLQSSSGY